MSESKYKDYQKQWYQLNKDRIALKQSVLLTCESCKKNIRRDAMTKHIKSNYHIKRLRQN